MSTRPASVPDTSDGQLSAIKRAFLAVERLQAKLDAVERARTEPIAIVGIGCRFPGGVRDLESYWTLLRDGVDAVTTVPPDRWDVDAYYDSDPAAPARMYTRSGGFLDAVDCFDAAFFGISPREASSMDPQQRLLLEVAWEALEHAGEPAHRLTGSRTGVFVGICTNDYAHLQVDDPTRFDLYYGSGVAHSIAAGRLSYVLGLRGPSMSVDTACSSSLVAAHLACQSLRAGECSMALVGAVNLILSPENMLTFCKSRMLAADGRSKTFDAAADGFVDAEGCGVVVLKRLSDAMTDGSRILAVIRGSAVNQDGASTGLTAPYGPAQEAVIRDALANGHVAPADVGYVEAHGTGTVLGDPIEVQALGAVLGRDRRANDPLVIGSVKTNFGHTQAAAGLAGLIKVVLALQHAEIPPHLHYREPNPHIPWGELPLVVPTERRPWIHEGRPRIAGVSSFGFSGTNAHVVLAEAPASAQKPVTDRPAHLLTLSARSEAALRQRAEDMRRYLATAEAAPLGDICFSANAGRAHLEHRLAVVTTSTTHLTRALVEFTDGSTGPGTMTGATRPAEPPKLAFAFTGQGSQYAGMGRELYDVEPAFRAAFGRCAELLGDRLGRPLLEILGDGAALEHTRVAQPALFAFEYALAEMWRGWKVEPVFVLGHSLGELTAACVAGVMSLADALALVVERGRLMQELPMPGAMAVLEAEEPLVAEAVAAEAGGGGVVAIAAVNAPRSIVIAGTDVSVDRVTAALAERRVPAQRLRGRHAFHCPLIDPVLPALEAAAARVSYGAPSTGLVSTLTGVAAAAGSMGQPSYWRDQARGTVQFAKAVKTLRARGVSVCLEIGPQPVLAGLGAQVADDVVWIGSLRRGRGDWTQILEALGRLYVAGVGMDLAAVESTGRRRLSLPTYPFERRRHWMRVSAPSAVPRSGAPRALGPGHPLVGRRVHSPALKQTVFEATLDLDALPYLRDHRVFGQAVYPAAAYLESVSAAAREAFGDRAYCLENVVLGERLLLTEGAPRCVQIVFEPPVNGESAFSLSSAAASALSDPEVVWRLHAGGTLRFGDPDSPAQPFSPDAIKARWAQQQSGEEHYRELAGRGFDFGPAFSGVRRIWWRERQAVARIESPAGLVDDMKRYRCHPALLDAGLQTLAVLAGRDGVSASDTYLPLRIDRFVVHRDTPSAMWSHVAVEFTPSDGADTIVADVRFADDRGELVIELGGMHMKRVTRQALAVADDRRFADWLHEVQWIAAPRAGAFGADGSRPDPAAVVRRVGAGWPALYRQHELSSYDELVRSLEALSASYVVAALRAMGASLRVGERLEDDRLAEALGVVQPHRRLFSRLLDMLDEDGILARRGAAYEVRREPAPIDLRARQRVLEAAFPDYAAELALLDRCGPELAPVLRGERDPLELVFPGGALSAAENLYEESPIARAYNTLLHSSIAAIVDQVPAARRLRVLEIGAGTGGSTRFVLPRLPRDRTEYVFTDISRAFTSRAAEKFGDYPFLRYRVLDIERPPAAQGFADERFDLVIAANVLHATSDLRRTLRHVQSLLAPSGYLALLEMVRPQRDVDLVFGLLEGWWKFSDHELRPRYPLLGGSRWVGLLRELGFRDPAALPADAVPSGSYNQAVIVAGFDGEAAAVGGVSSGSWLVVGEGGDIGSRLIAELQARGDRCRRVEINGRDADAFDRARLAEALGPDDRSWRGVVYVGGLDGGTPASSPMDLQSASCGVLLALVQELTGRRRPPRLWIVTRGAQAVSGDDRMLVSAEATLWGMAKVIALEHPELSCVRIDIDPVSGAVDVAALATELREPDGEDHVALRGGERYVARLVPSTADAAPATRHAAFEQTPVRLEINQRGILDNLMFRPTARRAPGPGEIEIEVRATGLNFRDVMGAMGLYPGDPGPLGGECAGTVVRLGPGVDTPRVGDEVVALAPGCFSTYTITRAEWAQPKPAHWTPAQGATVLIPFLTAVFALEHVGRVRRGERVLIHAAAGGVGLAALQIARRAGVQIFATAGSERKRAYLRAMGVDHVMSSRSTDFAGEVMAATRGAGVDLVLNSLAGELATASLSVLAPGGRFLEIGKTALLDPAAQAALPPGTEYSPIDWGETARAEPRLIGDMLRQIMAAFGAGEIGLLPVRSFPMASVVDAFRHMAQARHIGKIAVVHDESTGSTRSAGAPLFRADGTYVITGGLRGLGLVVAQHLVRGGAGCLVLMGRTAPGEEARRVIEEMRTAETRVVVVQGDVSHSEDVARMAAALADLPPVRGVLHAAGVLKDGVLRRLEWPDFAEVLRPKVAGAWLLARHTRAAGLDFFVLFSSAASVLGAAGQANHAAANAYLDTLAHELRAEGVPAISINWGVWSEIGAAAERNVDQRIGRQGVAGITPAEGVLVLDEILRRDRAQIAVLPVRWPTFLRAYPAGGEPPFFASLARERHRENIDVAPAGLDLLRELATMAPAQRRPRLTAHVRQLAMRVLGLEGVDGIDSRRPLNEIGLDSLMAVELRNLLGASVGRSLPATLLFDHPTIEAVVDVLAREIPGMESRLDTTAPVATEADTSTDALDRIEQLSDDEVERLLKQGQRP